MSAFLIASIVNQEEMSCGPVRAESTRRAILAFLVANDVADDHQCAWVLHGRAGDHTQSFLIAGNYSDIRALGLGNVGGPVAQADEAGGPLELLVGGGIITTVFPHGLAIPIDFDDVVPSRASVAVAAADQGITVCQAHG